MPGPRDMKKYEIEFGPNGECYVRSSELAERLLRLAEPGNELAMTIEATRLPPPNQFDGCEIPTPPINRATCPNDQLTLCPLSIRLVIPPERMGEWTSGPRDA